MRPKPKREVAIDWVREKDRTMGVHATTDAIEDFKAFGHIMDFSSDPSFFIVFVDPRYDFGEVWEYIKSY